jgi:hypothetical protein
VSTCPLCGHRKGKRVCPGKGGALICSVCCGSKRRVEVDCPSDCSYLTGSHAPSWEGRESDRRTDIQRVAPHIEPLTQDQAALFFYLVAGIVRVSATHRDADDARWLAAITAMRKTLETAASGLVYEHAAEDWQAQALIRDMRAVLEPPENEGKPVAPARELLATLKAVGAAIETAMREGAGPRAFLETAARLAGRIAQDEPKAPASGPSILKP